MPYRLEKVKNGFFVEHGKHRFSKKPLPKKRALSQLKALYVHANPAHEHIKLHGAGIIKMATQPISLQLPAPRSIHDSLPFKIMTNQPVLAGFGVRHIRQPHFYIGRGGGS